MKKKDKINHSLEGEVKRLEILLDQALQGIKEGNKELEEASGLLELKKQEHFKACDDFGKFREQLEAELEQVKTLSNIPTVGEFCKEYKTSIQVLSQKRQMIEFAKLHVKEALEASLKSALTAQDKHGYIDENSILNAYPLTNIK